MRRFVFLASAVVAVGCARSEAPPGADTAAMAPAAITLADVAGTWTVRLMPEVGDTTLLTYEMVATADTAGWTLTLPNRPTALVRVVAVEGDSVVTETGPVESVLRPGTMVTTHGVARLQGGMLVGTMVARYQTAQADSVVRFRIEGTRTP
jgi:hypothetical protein